MIRNGETISLFYKKSIVTKYGWLLLYFLISDIKSYSQNSCSVNSCFDIYIPNIITPNEDGLNERLKIVFQDCPCQVIQLKLFVINRWGNPVYREIVPSIENAFSWKGQSEYGQHLTEGIYFFLISLKVEINSEELSREWKGWIHVMR